MFIWFVQRAWLRRLGWLSIIWCFWFRNAGFVACCSCLLVLVVTWGLPLRIPCNRVLHLWVIPQSLQLWIVLRPGLGVGVWFASLRLALRSRGVGSSSASSTSSERLLTLAQAGIASNLPTLGSRRPVWRNSYRASLLHALRLLNLRLKADGREVPQKLFRVQKVAFTQLLGNRAGLMMLLSSLVHKVQWSSLLLILSLHPPASAAKWRNWEAVLVPDVVRLISDCLCGGSGLLSCRCHLIVNALPLTT